MISRIVHIFIFSLVIALSRDVDAEPDLNSLEILQWQQRIILLKRSDNCSDLLSLLTKEQDSISERDIVWFFLCNDDVSTNYSEALSDTFYEHINSNYFNEKKSGTILIGKDGSIKRSSDGFLLSPLFDLIDSMPMRRAEMRDRSF